MRKRQRAGTLERVVKYEQEAFSKAWDYLASSPSDGEDDEVFFFFFSFSSLFSPPKRGKIRPFLGRLIFFRPFMHAGGCMEKKEKTRGSTQKTPEIKKQLSPTASNTVNGPCNHKDLYLSLIHISEPTRPY